MLLLSLLQIQHHRTGQPGVRLLQLLLCLFRLLARRVIDDDSQRSLFYLRSDQGCICSDKHR